jgi:hypothetical protein
MTSRVAWWGAWTVASVTCLLALARLVLAIVDPASSDSTSAPSVPGGGVPVAAFEAAVLIVLAIIGGIVASRAPRNIVGWILSVIPLSLGVVVLGSHAFWAFALAEADTSRAAELIAWVASWIWVLALMPTVTFFPLLFPTGRPLSPRWRPMVWLSGVTVVVLIASEAFRPGRLAEYPIDNPFAAEGIATATNIPGSVLMVFTAVVSVASIVVRFRRSIGEERQQIKWVAAGAVMFVATFVASALTQNIVGEDASFATILAGFLFIASGVAVAIPRYRLYDIDVVINRALVYGSLTAMLAGVYLGSVLLLQIVLESFTGGSGLAVAASTLGTAALFGPLRTRVQGVVDRRFFRRRYDAAQTLQRFGAKVRDEVDLEALTTELRAVIGETIQPAHLSLWVHTRDGQR